MELAKRGKSRNILKETQPGKTEIATVLTKFTHQHNCPFVLLYLTPTVPPSNNLEMMTEPSNEQLGQTKELKSSQQTR